MKDGTDITVLLDRSGSMSVIRDDAMGGFNRFVEDQKKVPLPAWLSLVQFDDRYEPNYAAKPLAEVVALTVDTYQPRGMTALLDAMGRTINATGERLKALPEGERPKQVIFVVITDGQENSSHEFSRAKIGEMVRHQQDVYHWDFVYLGANQDSFAEAGAMGFQAKNVINYTATPAGTAQAYAAVSRGMAEYRSGGTGASGFWGGKTNASDDEDDKRVTGRT